jgi:hypothetical protein
LGSGGEGSSTGWLLDGGVQQSKRLTDGRPQQRRRTEVDGSRRCSGVGRCSRRCQRPRRGVGVSEHQWGTRQLGADWRQLSSEGDGIGGWATPSSGMRNGSTWPRISGARATRWRQPVLEAVAPGVAERW